jgi:hypothetical protein
MRDLIDEALSGGYCGLSDLPTAAELRAESREYIKSLEKDCLTMALRLLGEDETTFSPETAEVMKRWRPKCEAALRGEKP